MEHEQASRLDAALIAGLAAATLIASIAVAEIVTERLPHLEDEIAYIYQARVFARGELWGPPPPSYGFFTPFVVAAGEDRRVGKYPIGWPLALAIGEAVNAGWLVNPVIAAITIGLIYALGKELFGRWVGLAAAILALSSPLFLLQSATFMSHPISALWATLLAWAFLRAERAQSGGGDPRRWAAICGLAIGALAITRPLTAVAVALPFIAALGIRALRRPRQIGETIKGYWPLAAAALLIVAIQPLYTAILTGDPTTNLYLKVWPYDRIGFGPGYGRGEDGHTLAKAWRTAQSGVKLLASDLFGWRGLSWLPLIPGLALGTIQAAPGRRHWPALLCLPTALLVAAHMAYWVGAQVYGPRYYYEGHAGMAILAAVGILGTVRLIVEGLRRIGTRLELIVPPFLKGFLSHSQRYGAAATTLAALLAINLVGYLPRRMGEWHGLYGITRAPLDQLESFWPYGKTLVLIRGGHWQDYAAFFAANSPWHDGPLVAAHDNAAGRSAAVIELYPGYEVWFYHAELRQFSRQPLPYSEANN